jgi:hypothetical protein
MTSGGNSLVALVVVTLPLVLLSVLAAVGVPRLAQLPGILAFPLLGLVALGYVSLFAATIEIAFKVMRGNAMRPRMTDPDSYTRNEPLR